MIDSRPFGGTCALRGCDPKKVLVGVAELIDHLDRMKGKGIVGDAHIDWRELMQFKNTFTEPVPSQREQGMVKSGIKTFHGRARFSDSNTLQVRDESLTGNYILLANGARPATLNIPGEDHLSSSDQFLELETLPKRILFAGGGYISFEFAHIAARAGADAQILHRGARPLEGFDVDLVDRLLARTKAIGIDVHLHTELIAINKQGESLAIHANENGREQTYTADMVVHGAGRVPDLDDMDLEKGGVKHEQRGVTVNQYLQSVTNPSVYAAGDAAATPGLPLTPVGGVESRIAAANMLEGNHREIEYPAMPTVVFTTPVLASVGLREDQARDQGLTFETHHEDISGWYASRRVAERCAAYKVLVESDSDRILGAHLLGPHAEEVINLFAMAITYGLTGKEIKKMIFAYPTNASDLGYMV
jgi:glutathione reductase (NADPH)